MNIGPVIIAVLAAATLVVAGVCIRRPVAGIVVTILALVPMPLFPTENYGWVFYGFAGFMLLVLSGWLLSLTFHNPPFCAGVASEGIGSALKLWLVLCLF